MKSLLNHLLAAILLLPTLAFGGWNLEALMADLAKAPPGRIPFREYRHSAFLDAPIVITGQLTRTPDGRFGKEVTSPEPSSFWIEGERVRMERPGQPPREIKVESEPALAAFVAGFHATLRGDLATLRRHYQLKLDGDPAQWQLELTPLAPASRALLSRITIEGSGARPGSFKVEEANGDHSRMELGAP